MTTRRHRLAILSCVGGGPMERMARRMREMGHTAEVVAGQRPEAWRARMASGSAGRAIARVSSMVAYPAASVAEAFRGVGVLVPTTNPFHLPLVLVATRPLHGRPVVALVYDLYPDALEAGAVASSGGVVATAAAAANRFWFRRADGVVFIGDRMAAHARERYGEPRRWTVIPTGADLAEFETAGLGGDQPLDDLERWCAARVLVASYVGNFGHMHEWETLATSIRDAAADLRAAGVGIVIAASGPGVERLRAAWEELDDLVRFEVPLADLHWARLLARSHVALVTLRPEAVNTCVPSKAFSAMAAGNAVLAVAPGESDLAKLVTNEGCGRVAAPGDPTKVSDALLAWARDRAELDERRHASARAVRERYDMRRIAGQWAHFLDEVLAERSPGAAYEGLKRALDLAVGAGVLVAASPVMLGAACGIRATMGSPVVFRQERPGRGGEPFRLVKFRTMRHARPGEQGPEADAARLTRLGRVLRATSIDELPTMWNVVRGDMSLVGPRPLLMRYLPRYSERQSKRHDAKPGVTGWAQVNGRNALGWDEKLEMDAWYVEHRSITLDLRILLRTIGGVLGREGISQPGHATMTEFLGSMLEEGNLELG